MSTSILNVKVDSTLKKKAMNTAKKIGLPLSAVVNNYLRHFVVRKSVTFSEPLIPNERTVRILNQATKDIAKNKNIVHFDSQEELDAFLLE